MEARQVLLYAGAMAATLVLLNLIFYEELEAGNFSTPEIEINGGDSAYFGGGADSPVLPEPDSPNTPIIPKPNSPDTRYNSSTDSIANRDTTAEASKALSSEVPVREKASAEDNRRRQRAIECERWSEFRSEIYKPKEMAPSILEREEPCNGECVAVCICGSLRTFFEPKISKSIVETLINGFNPSGKTDVFMVVSEEHSAKGGVYVIPKQDQCDVYSQINLVGATYMQQRNVPKTHRCRQHIQEVEKRTGKKYDWVLRPRPDSFWKQMNLRVATAEKQVYYRHDQFTMLPRDMLHNFIWPFRGTPEHEVDVNEDNPMFEFYLWRTSRVLGLKFHYYESLCLYMEPMLCGPCTYGNKDAPSPAFYLLNKARDMRDVSHIDRLRKCLHNMFSIGCHQLRQHFTPVVPAPQNTKVDVKAIMERIGDVVEKHALHEIDSIGRALDEAQKKLREELMVPQDAQDGWMPSLQRACALECSDVTTYSKGPWQWSCLSHELKSSLAFRWHPPGFAVQKPGDMGEC